MIDIRIIKALADCTILNGVLQVPIQMDESEVVELQHALRNCILEGLVPVYKPIKFFLYGIPLSSMIDFNSDINKCLLDMLTPLHEAICYPTEDILEKTTISWDLNQVIERGPNKANFSTPNITGVESFNVGIENMFTAYSRTTDKVYVNDLHPHIVKDELPTDRMEDYGLRPLLLDSEDIFKIRTNSGTMPQCHTLWAIATETMDYHDIELSTSMLRRYGVAIKQDYSLTPYLIPAIRPNNDSKLFLNYRRRVDEEVLQSIIRGLAITLLAVYNNSAESQKYAYDEFVNSYKNRLNTEGE